MITAVRGTKDIFDKDSVKMDYVVRKAEEVFKNYGYKHIYTPIFEETALFKRGIGEGSDIVRKEMYSFTDLGGREITLRPEGTASVVRAYMEHKMYGREDFSKLYYWGPMFRYERPQAGRYREFYQVGVEAIGSNAPLVDAEIIAMGYGLLRELGIDDIEVQINSVGCPDCRKIYRDKLREFLATKLDGLCSDCKDRYEKNPLRVLDCKVEKCKELTIGYPKMLDYLDEECRVHFEEVKKYLDMMGVPYIINPRLVRGLDYYTNTAFEIVTSKLGAQGTVLAGGRYNNLIEEIGGKSIPGVGFAAGVERISMLLDNDFTPVPDIYTAVIGHENLDYAVSVMSKLRNNGFYVEMDMEQKSMKNQMKKAAKLNSKYTVIIGEEEKREGTLVLKNMGTGEQEKTTIESIIKRLKEDKI